MGNHFLLRTDHSALTSLLKTPEPVGQQARWLDLIAEYDFKIVHRAGEQHRNVDSLSRRPCERNEPVPAEVQCENRDIDQLGTSTKFIVRNVPIGEPERSGRNVPSSEAERSESIVPSTEQERSVCSALKRATGQKTKADDHLFSIDKEQVREEQIKDATTSSIIRWLQESGKDRLWTRADGASKEVQLIWSQANSLEVNNGVLYRRFETEIGSTLYRQIVVPLALREVFLKQLHGGSEFGHFGTSKTMHMVQQYAYWPGWKNDVEKHVRRCTVCCRSRHGPRNKQGPLQSVMSDGPMRKLHVDLTGPHVRSKNGFVYLLTAICQFTKYLVAVPLRDKTALSVAKALVKHVYLVYGSVELQVTDQGREFCNQVLENVYKLMGIQPSRTTSYRPSSNGVVERVHSTINGVFSKLVAENQRDWCEWVPVVTYCYNISYHTSTRTSPFYLMFLREPMTGIDLLLENPTNRFPANLDDYTDEMATRMQKAYQLVADHLDVAFSRSKRRYDTRVKEVQFQVGDLVWYYCPRRKLRRNRKWQLMTTGPHLILRKLNFVNYVIRFTPNGKRQIIVHVDRIRKYEEEIPPEWERFKREHRIGIQNPDLVVAPSGSNNPEHPGTTAKELINIGKYTGSSQDEFNTPERSGENQERSDATREPSQERSDATKEPSQERSDATKEPSQDRFDAKKDRPENVINQCVSVTSFLTKSPKKADGL